MAPVMFARSTFAFVESAPVIEKIEVMIIFLTPDFFYLHYRQGIVDLLKEISTRRNVNVRILLPIDDRIRILLTTAKTRTNTKEKVSKMDAGIEQGQEQKILQQRWWRQQQ